MKGESVLLDEIDGRRAAARLKDGRLEDLLIDGPMDGPPSPGTVFRAKVERAVKGQGGVFLTLPDGSAYLRDGRGLSQGQTMLVQVTGFTEPGKAVPVTHKVLFKSKYAIVTPGAPGSNISRSIRDEEVRVRLRAVLSDLILPEGIGLILRSEAAEADSEAVAEDAIEMLDLCEALASDSGGDPECLLEGPDAHHLAWREWGEPKDIGTSPGCFEERGVLDELEGLRSSRAELAGGGHMWIEPTRALVAVDVNSGRDLSPAATLKSNLAAAQELPRQLRLRGLGGQVTVDLAPVLKKDRKQIEQAFRKAFRGDSIETALIGWTPLGHLEFQRKRERRPISEVL